MEKTSPFSSAQPFLSIPIVMSKPIDQSLGLGLRFRGWTYAIASITLTPERLPLNSDLDSIACLVTGCGVTLVDRDWLLKRLSYQNTSIMSISLKVRGISAFKHESAEFVTLSLYFPGKKNAGQLVYAALKCEIYLVKGL